MRPKFELVGRELVTCWFTRTRSFETGSLPAQVR